MPKLAAADLLREIGSEHPPQLCFLCGEDTLAVTQLEKRIRKKLTDGDALSDTVFDGQEVDLDRLADACSFSPMFQPYNLILIPDFDPDAHPSSAVDTMLGIFAEPAPRTVILIVMALAGLWHGAGWNFVLWGVAIGTMQVIARTPP